MTWYTPKLNIDRWKWDHGHMKMAAKTCTPYNHFIHQIEFGDQLRIESHKYGLE